MGSFEVNWSVFNHTKCYYWREPRAQLQTGVNSNLLSMHRKLKLASSLTRLCGQEDHTSEYVLQRCPLHKAAKEDVRPISTPLTTKLYGCMQELEKTTSFTSPAALIV